MAASSARASSQRKNQLYSIIIVFTVIIAHHCPEAVGQLANSDAGPDSGNDVNGDDVTNTSKSSSDGHDGSGKGKGTFYLHRRQYYTDTSSLHDVTVCQSTLHRDNASTSAGTNFVCPEEGQPSDHSYCCGDSDAQYCCDFWQDTTREVGLLVGLAVGLLLLIACCWCLCRCVSARGKRRKVVAEEIGRKSASSVNAAASDPQAKPNQIDLLHPRPSIPYIDENPLDVESGEDDPLQISSHPLLPNETS